MAISPFRDKKAIADILSSDSYLTSTLGFTTANINRVKYTDETLSATKKQIFIYNAQPEDTPWDKAKNIVYEIDVSAAYANNGSVDNAIEQVIALLDGVELYGTHRIELLDPPNTLSAPNSIYQVGVRFYVPSTVYNSVR